MLIKLGNIELCRGRLFSEIPINFRINGDRKIQKTPRIRAKNMMIQDRGNLSHSISFTVTRKHLSHEEAAEYALMLNGRLNGYDTTCYFQLEDSKIQMALHNCVMESINCQIQGSATIVFYQILGGALNLIQHK
jgi:hypothetical protein